MKLTDFDLSKDDISDNYGASMCGKPDYLITEVLDTQCQGKAVDWYSLGAFIFEMLEGLTPFYKKDRASHTSTASSLHVHPQLSTAAVTTPAATTASVRAAVATTAAVTATAATTVAGTSSAAATTSAASTTALGSSLFGFVEEPRRHGDDNCRHWHVQGRLLIGRVLRDLQLSQAHLLLASLAGALASAHCTLVYERAPHIQ